ncbi:hypothetical protein Poly21_28090 [Allorhodopirellula heiligendammensis]|uniref:Uncharacterized protein n=1 Tax=Allorhodopirellula heiligendammensis TaxID=2714739 RepID=A0A5C6BUT7_9BACT|nr:hypothetical protein Poly21_28090 [Allorhodopirellula heiligendammensis]
MNTSTAKVLRWLTERPVAEFAYATGRVDRLEIERLSLRSKAGIPWIARVRLGDCGEDATASTAPDATHEWRSSEHLARSFDPQLKMAGSTTA